MAIKLPDGTFACPICHLIHPTLTRADMCRDAHNMLYFPISKDELNRLLIAIHTGDMSVLSDSLLDRMESYNRKTLTSE